MQILKRFQMERQPSVNTLYGNPLPDMDLYELTLEKTELILYAIYETEETFPGTFAKEWRLAYKP